MSTAPDYGLDAPGVLRGLAIGAVAALGASAVVHGAEWWFRLTASICILELVWMVWGSRVGKLRHRDRVLDALGLRTGERVLDVGCGHGLLTIGAARRGALATGIDLWSQTDQQKNSRDATLENARLEGVAERVNVVDGDMRALPFEAGSFDVAVANLSIHNIPEREGRRKAIQELARVLVPGGRVSLTDFRSTGEYADDLRSAGFHDVAVSGLGLLIFPPVRVVTGRKGA